MDRNCSSFVLLLILGIVRITGVSGNCDYLNRNKSTVTQLKKHLFCQYDSDVRPVHYTDNVTDVHLYIMPKFFEYVSVCKYISRVGVLNGENREQRNV